MDRLIYTAMSGASQTMSRQAAVAHNLANVASAGYRAEEHRLRAVQVQSQALPTRAFVVDASTHTNFSSGPMQSTGRALDVAVQGPGWIALAMPDGSEAYTRNGSLQLDVNGVLQTRNGIPVQGDGGPISVPPDVKVSIGTDGSVSAIPESGEQNTVNAVGRIKLVNPDETELVRGADGLFRLRSGEAAQAEENAKLASGFLEGSNVNAVEQMVSMISLARQFDMQMKLLNTASTNDQAATQVISNL
ncbi:flagellar component of cell-proximal portion of basal-body rod [Sterolibacterium denitrificans]|uniref:Flagellar basal-body rod protein FlgF n=2 Tax=Sterolibacterium denitrificans TaxID=157592 RepID=A0A656Z9V6_9PROT|nr:flagellar basal-body rod protein FlgF [Sterolibacterium denitrificans]KYC29315.1 flagellar basal body rod protein FlgF [Sterolibacterium denitrificans]SMB30713.1 flagellar component of cell-proximal portion of basal-body rod [Sterolibacterium denitrificans]